MKRILPLAAASAALLTAAACSSVGTPAQVAEKADTAAADTYVAIATSLNAYEQTPGANVTSAEGLKLQAWKAFATEQQVYAATKTVDLSALTALAAQVHTLTGH